MPRVTQQELAKHLGHCSVQTIRTYETEGIIKRTKTGYDQDKCRDAVFAYLRDRAGGRLGNADGYNLTAEKARRERSQSVKNEFALKLMQGLYVLVEDVGLEAERLFGIVRERLLAIPGKSADKCAESDPRRRDMIFAILNEEITEALNALSSPQDVAGAAVRVSVPSAEGPAEAEPDTVGGPEPTGGGEDEREPGTVED